jgi:hypothetical protein
MINFPEFTAENITKRTSAEKACSRWRLCLSELCCDIFTQVHQIAGRALVLYPRRIRRALDEGFAALRKRRLAQALQRGSS